MPRANDRFDVSPNIEVADDLHLPGVQQLHEIIENDVHDVLVEDPAIAILIDVELEALQLHAPVARNVLDEHRGEIRKARGRTDTGELRARKLHGVAADLDSILEAHQARFADHL